MRRPASFMASTFCLALGLLSPGVAAWGAIGHETVAVLADRLLAEGLDEILRKDLGHESLEEAAIWCDHFDHTAAGHWSEPLHYINYPNESCNFRWSRDCVDDFCNVGAVSNYTKQLADRSLSQDRRRLALQFVLHMLGDLHQPLHVGSAEDLGGNRITLAGVDFSPEATENKHHHLNLHAVWDDTIISEIVRELGSPLKDGRHQDDYTLLVNHLQTRLKADWHDAIDSWRQPVDVGRDDGKFRTGLTAIAEASAELSCSAAYTDPEGHRIVKGARLSREYYEAARPVVEEQLAKAAVRLAQVLSNALQDSAEKEVDLIFA